jgi:hypothetical protein
MVEEIKSYRLLSNARIEGVPYMAGSILNLRDSIADSLKYKGLLMRYHKSASDFTPNELKSMEDFDKAFESYMRTGVMPKGYYLDKREYWKGYNHGLSSNDAKSSAFKRRKIKPVSVKSYKRSK